MGGGVKLSREAFAKGMKMLKSVFDGRLRGNGVRLSEETYEAYYFALQNIPDELFKMGIMRLLQTYNKVSSFPLPGEIHQAVVEILEERAERIWRTMLQAARSPFKGSYVEKFVADPVTMFVLKNFFDGWLGFCRLPESSLEKEMRAFQEKYAYYYLHPEEMEEIEYLEGLATDGSVLRLDEVPKILAEAKERKRQLEAKQSKQLPSPSEEELTEEERRRRLEDLKRLEAKIAKPMPQVTAEEVEREAARVN